MLVAMLPARLPPPKAEPARFDAWLNLSHLEKARVFMMVKTRAMTVKAPISATVTIVALGFHRTYKLTDKRQPQELQPDERQDGHDDPQDGLDVQREPEEAAVGGVDDLCARVAALEHPLGLARGRVDLVPPAEADEAAAGDVLEVVEVGGEEEDGDDEDHDPACARRESSVSGLAIE